ncbi:MAG: hypothetical protein GY913_00720 [Proteobacteria bacterium]|nr:hypothetical protein [Pseudomonadota bacterium]MCP4915420.1 hypothetical protein [Pseudomonadota bacterium]
MTLLLLSIALAAPPSDRPSGEPPHEILLSSLDELGIDAERQEAMRALQASLEGRELMEAPMDELTDEERERAKELVPPPPGRDGDRPDGDRPQRDKPSR